MFNDISLRTRLMLMTLAAIFLPLTVSGTYFCNREVTSIYDSQADYLLSSSKHICQDIDFWVTRQKGAIRAISETKIIRDFVAEYNKIKDDPQKVDKLRKQFSEKAEIMNKSMPQVSELCLSSLGDNISYTEDNLQYSDLKSKPEGRHLQSFYIGGNIYFSTNSKHIGLPWLPAAMLKNSQDVLTKLNKGEVVLSQRSIINTESSGHNSVHNGILDDRCSASYLSILVYKEPNNGYYVESLNQSNKRVPTAILTFRLNPINIRSLSSHGNFYVVDDHGQIISMPFNVTKKAMQLLSPSEVNLANDESPAELKTFYLKTLDGNPSPPLIEYLTYRDTYNKLHPHYPSSYLLEHAIDDTYNDIFGNRVIGAWSACSQINWFVLSEFTEAELFYSLRRSVLISAIITVSIGAVFMILAFFTANSLVKPIIKLSQAASKIAGGDHTTRCHITRRDEIGRLASAFDAMASRIEKTMTALKTARDQAMEASRIKSSFLANMSHELRTPLNAIIGYSEMLIDDATDRQDTQAVKDLQNIHIAGLNLLSNINDILNISRLESGKVGLFIEKFPLSELIAEVNASTSSLYQVNNNKFELDCPNQSIMLHTDHAKLRQILINLLGNAVKFTKNGVIKLSVELWSGQQAQNEFYKVPYLDSPGYTVVEASFKDGSLAVIFSVQDTGIGMTEEKFSKVFEEFTQADDSISRSYGGTGLGLALVRHYSHMLKARLELISKDKVGSAFTLKIPLAWEEKEEKRVTPEQNKA
ncbi:MAG: sensor histidine kinase [Candidatus Bruticola sp.]